MCGYRVPTCLLIPPVHSTHGSQRISTLSDLPVDLVSHIFLMVDRDIDLAYPSKIISGHPSSTYFTPTVLAFWILKTTRCFSACVFTHASVQGVLPSRFLKGIDALMKQRFCIRLMIRLEAFQTSSVHQV